jgi:predicted transglutaminase-like cysteine proteinase
MGQNLILAVAAILSLGSTLATSPAAQAASNLPNARFLAESQVAAPQPAGFINFCSRFADQCATHLEQPARAALTPELWRQLEEVNFLVNRTIHPMDDFRHYGRADYWTIPTDGFGDCEDYALTKRKALIAAGVPARALRMAVVRTRQGEGHAVLTIATDRGDFVLDNLSMDVRGWDATGYEWIARQNPDDVWAWVSLDPKVQEPLLMVASVDPDMDGLD